MSQNKEAFEPTGLIPRSIIRTVDRFLQQLLPGKEKIAIQEYRVSRYQILVSIKSLFIIVSIPLIVNYTVKAVLLTPLTEHFWNLKQTEIFLNQYQEKRAFAEMQDFSEKMFFELLSEPSSDSNLSEQSPNYYLSRDHQQNVGLVSKQILTTERSSQPFSKPDVQCDSVCTASPLLAQSSVCSDPDLSFLPVRRTKCAPTKLPCISDVTQKAQKVVFTNLGLTKQDLSFPHTKCENIRLNTQSDKAWLCTTGNTKSILEATRAKLCFAQAEPNQIDLEKRDMLNTFEVLTGMGQTTVLLTDISKAAFQAKSFELAESYNKQSILAITNLLGDFVTFLTLCSLFRVMRPEIIILKSFLTESVYSLSDTTKSFLLILGMDLLVGFHSPRGWEIVLEGLLRHVGLPENENFVLLFVALFPVFLDTVFKYWIFRYLNKISPSTVVTYHSMIE